VASAAGIETMATADQPGGSMEGKETRFGIASSVLTSNVTSNPATGSFNSMHDSSRRHHAVSLRDRSRPQQDRHVVPLGRHRVRCPI